MWCSKNTKNVVKLFLQSFLRLSKTQIKLTIIKLTTGGLKLISVSADTSVSVVSMSPEISFHIRLISFLSHLSYS